MILQETFWVTIDILTCSQLLERLKCESQTENSGRARSRGMLLGSQYYRGVEGVLELRDGTRKN